MFNLKNNVTKAETNSFGKKVKGILLKGGLSLALFTTGYAVSDSLITAENGTIEVQAASKASIIKTNKSGKKYSIQSSAYTATCYGCTGRTATGYNVTRTVFYKGYRIVAADTRVFPMGTVLSVPGVGKVVVLDRGGAIKGYKLDVLHASRTNAYNYGRKYGVGVKVLGRIAV